MNSARAKHLEHVTVDDGAGPPIALAVGGMGSRQSVLLLPAIAGIDEYILVRAAQLVAHGFQVAVLDYYGPSGAKPDLSTPERIGAAVAALDDREVLANVRRTQVWLRSSAVQSEQLGVLGFCIGGTYSILASAADTPPTCTVAYYGQLRNPVLTETKPQDALDAAIRLRAPLLGHFGDMDRLIPMADITAFAEQARTAKCHAEIHAYPGAPHAFDEWHRPPVFRPVASAEAWRRTLVFLDWHLRGVRSA